jgi:hypothetical protein
MLARIRIRGSGSSSFRQWLSRCQKKIFFKKFSLFLLFAGYIYISHLKKEIMVFLTFCLMMEGSGSKKVLSSSVVIARDWATYHRKIYQCTGFDGIAPSTG